MKYFVVLTIQPPGDAPRTYAAEIAVKPGTPRNKVFDMTAHKLLGRPPVINRDVVLFWSLEKDQLG